MSDVTAYGLVDVKTNILEGTLQREVSYTVSLKVQPPAQNANYTIEKASDVDTETERTVYTPIREEVDLLESSDEFRICISENVGDNGSYVVDKCQFYRIWGIMGKIDIYIPVKIEISKMAADNPENYVADEVSAIIELVDPPENIGTIKGPKGHGRCGADFVSFLKSQVSGGDGGDNCPNIFAPIQFQDRCRSVQGNVDNPQKIILDESKRQFRVYTENPNAVIVPIRKVEEKIEGSNNIIRIGYARILLHFPPVAGNNYRLKIRLINRNGQEAVLRDKDNPDLYPLYFQTPTITVWKKIKIEMVALQEGINYEDMKWKVVKSAFADAFIEVEEPPPEKRYTITREEWMRYLGEEVYRGWRKSEWKEYSKPNYVNEQTQDLRNYSFPQAHPTIPGSQKLTPPDEDPQNLNRDSWTFLEKMAKRVFREKLGGQTYNRLRNPLRGIDIGVCTLICKPPFQDSSVGGLSFFNKMFYIVSGLNMESTFVHEFGHALFLRHGATYFVKNTDIPFTTRCEESGSEGPYWDDHDSDDMITCVMSYNINNVEWHFCGLCLLTLRLYDRNRMIRGEDNTLRTILYHRTPTVYWVEDSDKETVDQDGWSVIEPWLKIHQNPPESLIVGEELRLLALYPSEEVVNDDNIDYKKDLTKYERGSWISTNTKVGRIRVRKENKIWIAKIKIVGRGRTEVKYRISRGPNNFIESAPLVFETQ
ncbi:MAG: hypothetical protein N3F64_02715 [Nitrososphaeria archaeon]|nr:hypothetical protein [Nitrososphaeria archaeon]